MRNRANRIDRRIGRGKRPLLRLQNSRAIVTFLAVLAIALQSFVVQTHIHNPQAIASFSLVKSADNGASGTTGGKFTGNDDSSNCRLCQELAYAGRFVAPSSTMLVLPIIIAWLLVVFSHSATIPTARSYVWRSRAPPAHS